MAENEDTKVEETEETVTETEPSTDPEEKDPKEETTESEGSEGEAEKEDEPAKEEKEEAIVADMLATENPARMTQIYSMLADQDNVIRSNTEDKKSN